MNKLFFDIETLPAEKEKEKILLDIYKRKIAKGNKSLTTFEEYLEKTGLDGTFGRIACIGYAINDAAAECLVGDEKKMLQDFWEIAKTCDLFVGFNNMDFDLRFIYQRSVIQNVRPTKDLIFARYRSSPIYDVMHEWKKWDNQSSISLHALAKALGLQSSKEGGIEGSGVAKAYEGGKIKEIAEYCKRDVEVTRKIYKRMTFES
jgi:predicted PolB exonuclease-like 3'-5' exonuclease